MGGVGAAVGRPKKKRPDSGSEPEHKTIAVRATLEWAKWLEKGARHCRTDMAKLIDAAVVRYLRAEGFAEEAPDRVPQDE